MNDVQSHKVLLTQIITTKTFKNISNSVWDNRHCIKQTMYKTNRFHLAVRVYSDNVQMTSKRGDISQATPAARSVFLCSYHVLSKYTRTAKWNIFVKS